MIFRKKRCKSVDADHLEFAVDALEERRMLAVVAVTGGGTSLKIRGDNTSETVQIGTSAAGVVTVNGQSTGMNEIKKLTIVMKGGDDVVSISDDVVVTRKSIIKLGTAGAGGNQLSVGGQHSFLKIIGGKQGDDVTLTSQAGTAPRVVNLKGGNDSFSVDSTPPPTTSITATINYSLDTNNFFNSAAKRDLLQSAADEIVSRFGDDLTAISPSGSNSWTAQFFHPGNGQVETINNLDVAANELIIYAGGQNLGGNLGEGGPGGYSASGTASWIANVERRGESGAAGGSPTDFGPWGGAITFDTSANWHFGETTAGLDSDEFDFYSVAVHELSHLFGFGTAPSHNTFVAGAFFTGPKSVAAYDLAGNVPLSADRGHWANGTLDGGAGTAFDPSISSGVRRGMTGLDYAGLDDIGWDIT